MADTALAYPSMGNSDSQRTSALSPRRLCGRARSGSTSSAVPMPLNLSTFRSSSFRTRAHTDVPPTPDSPVPETPIRARDMFDSLALKLRSLPTDQGHEADTLTGAARDVKTTPIESPPRRTTFASLFVASPMPIPALPTPVLSGGSFAVSCARAALPESNRRRQYLLPLIFLALVFVVTSIPVIWGIFSLPIHSLDRVPRTLQEIAILGRELQAYADSGLAGKAHVLGVLSIVSSAVLFSDQSSSKLPGCHLEACFFNSRERDPCEHLCSSLNFYANAFVLECIGWCLAFPGLGHSGHDHPDNNRLHWIVSSLCPTHAVGPSLRPPPSPPCPFSTRRQRLGVG